MIETIGFNGKSYPKFQSEGFAAKFAFPFAKEVCKGEGLDIGYCRPEWKLPGAIGVDDKKWAAPNGIEMFKNEAGAMSLEFLRDTPWDYIFSSHCLEHLPNWVDALNYWHSCLKVGGVLFLYLPHFKQSYWRPWHNRKHIHCFTPEIIEAYFGDPMWAMKAGAHADHPVKIWRWSQWFISGADLNDSFYAIAEKR